MRILDEKIAVFTKAEWKVLFDWASPSETAASCHGIGIDIPAGRAWSADGRRCVMLSLERGHYSRTQSERLIPYEICRQLLRAAKGKSQIRIVENLAQVTDENGIASLTLVIPDAGRPVPVYHILALHVTGEPASVIGMSAEYLGAFADVAKAVRLYGKGKTPLITLHFGAAREPVLFRADAAAGGYWDFLIAPVAV